MARPGDPMVGRTIAQYEILARVGGGGMGVVYRARDTRLGRPVAIKFLPQQWSHDESARQRFQREAQAASATNHPSICTIHDIEEAEDGQLFIVMAFYEGETLKERIARGRLPLEEALDIAMQVADGLAKAHAQGVVHRDIKPGNLILTEDGVRILDFGLATFADALKLTIENSTLGTAAYMSPEQVRGQPADARSDVWSTGVVLYEMLTGHVPFQGTHAEAIAYAVRNESPTPVRSERAEVPEEVEQLVFRALHKEPAVRYQNGRELARALRQVRGQSLPLDLRTEPVPRPIRPTASAGRAPWRRRLVALLAALVLLAGGLFVYRRLAPVERISVVIAPVFNSTGDGELDRYRRALTLALVTDLADSPNIRVIPYARVLEVVRRFIGGGADMSDREAVRAIANQTASQYVVLPTLMYEGSRWKVRADIQDASTSTIVASVETDSVPSAIATDTAYTLVGQIATQIQEHFRPLGPGRSYAPRPASARLRSLDAADAFEKGIDAVERLEFASAEAAFSRASMLDSRSPLAPAWLSRVEGLLRKRDEASRAADTAARLLADNTPEVDRLFVSAIVDETRGDVDRAEAGYRRLVDRYPDDPSWLLELGDFQDRRSQVEPAIVSYQGALALDPGAIQPDVELCRMYNRLNDYANARTHGQEALKKAAALATPEAQVQALFCLTEVLRDGTPDERKEARRLAESALDIVKSSGLTYNLSWAYHYVALAFAEEGNLPEGASFWEMAATAAHDGGNRELEPVVLMNLGVVYARLGDRQRAMDYYGQSSEAHRAMGNELRAARVQMNRAQLRIDFGDDPDRAVKDVENALQVFEAQSDQNFQVFAHQALGSYYRYVARFGEAERELRQAVSIASRNGLRDDVVEMNIELARVFFDQSRYAEAQKLLESVGDGFEEYSLHAWIRLARTRLYLGDVTQARALLRKAEGELARKKNSEYAPLLYTTLGELEFETGRLPEALTYFKRSADMWTSELPDPASVEARAYVGLIDVLGGRAGRPMIDASLAQAAKMRQVLLEVRCRVFLSRALLQERRSDTALGALAGITWDGPGAVGSDVLAEAHRWRAAALAASGRAEEADAERAQAKRSIEAVLEMVPESDRSSFLARPRVQSIRVLRAAGSR